MLVHTLAATLGLAALLRTVPAAYRVVKYAGAVYRIYLGVRAIRTDEFDAGAADADSGGPGGEAAGSFRRGVLVNVLNPKVALFFLAFLPGFAGSAPDAPARMALLGATYAGLTAAYPGVVAIASGCVGRALSPATTQLRWLGGGAMIALGVALAVE